MFLRAIVFAMRKVFVLDDLETKLSYYRAREITCGEAEKHYNKALKLIDDAMNTRQLNRAKKLAFAEMDKTQINPKKEVLYVDITGEIYLVCDLCHFVSLNNVIYVCIYLFLQISIFDKYPT